MGSMIDSRVIYYDKDVDDRFYAWFYMGGC